MDATAADAADDAAIVLELELRFGARVGDYGRQLAAALWQGLRDAAGDLPELWFVQLDAAAERQLLVLWRPEALGVGWLPRGSARAPRADCQLRVAMANNSASSSASPRLWSSAARRVRADDLWRLPEAVRRCGREGRVVGRLSPDGTARRARPLELRLSVVTTPLARASVRQQPPSLAALVP